MPIQDSTFLIRGGTAAQMASANPVLRAREPAVETDTGKGKFGDGSTTWNSLPYSFGPGAGGAVVSVNGQTGAVTITAAGLGAAVTGHSHATTDITNLAEFIRDTIGAALVAGDNMTVTVNDGADTITLESADPGGGGGAVDSVNGQTGVVVLSAANVGAAAASHNHTSGNITDWLEAVQDAIGATIVAGTNVTISYNDVANTFTINSTANISTLTYANAPAGDRFDVPGNPVASNAARPSARTDIFFDWETSDGLMPTNALDGDNWLNAVEGP